MRKNIPYKQNIHNAAKTTTFQIFAIHKLIFICLNCSVPNNKKYLLSTEIV